jgi:glycosyltransferase involved in cell wall biosynthesis
VIRLHPGRKERSPDESVAGSAWTPVVEQAAPPVRAELERRIELLLDTVGSSAPRHGRTPFEAVSSLCLSGPAETWLALATLIGELPVKASVLEVVRAARIDGPSRALADAVLRSGRAKAPSWPRVEIVSDGVMVDVHHTSRTTLATGIQRVAREAVSRWQRHHDLQLVGWSDGYCALRRLEPDELQGPRRAATGSAADDGLVSRVRTAEQDLGSPPMVSVVPWRCTFLLPELSAEWERAARTQAIALYSGCRTGFIGFDCVPLMAPETAADGMPGGFSRFLAAASHFDRLAAISESAAWEYGAWRAMLAGSGRIGPEIKAVPLAVEARAPSQQALNEARALLTVGRMPVVLCVGSHEPRKNHLAVLHAAEVLWKSGLEFSLTFVGGNAWKSESFEAEVRRLQDLRRPVQTILALPDELLWSAYRVAYCTVFVSLHEGFGLPIAESLASGTPVITSNFGSMQHLAGSGGALVVDPHDDAAIAAALRRLLLSPGLRQRLADEAARIGWRTWDDYARETWDFLVGG